MTLLGIPQAPAPRVAGSVGPVAFTASHHFTVTGDAAIEDPAEAATVPLSVILQVTKRCNFDCSFCSETLQLPDPTLPELDTIRTNLAGVQRVFLSGGEPLMRCDFGDIVDMYTGDFILGIPTNATRAAASIGPWEILLGLRVHPDSRQAFAASLTDTRMPGGMYRNQCWLPYADRDVLLCLGIHGQLVYVDPAARLVGVKVSSWRAPQDPAMLAATLQAFDAIAAHDTSD
jgi:hypothetical protein